MASGAWGKKASDAIRAPPPPPSQSTGADQRTSGGNNNNSRRNNNGNNNSNNNRNNSSARGGGGRGRGGRAGGGGRGRSNNNNNSGGAGGGRHKRPGEGHNNNNHSTNSNRHERIVIDVDLLGPGEGATPQQKAVKRHSLDDLLARRLDFLDGPRGGSFDPPPHCAWTGADRVQEIAASLGPRMGGEVSRAPQSKHDTAPPLEDCKPLKVNDETRWKARVFDGNDAAGGGAAAGDAELTDEQVLKKALLILNKLSLTKFEKLSDEFVAQGIGRSPSCLSGAVEMIVEKAQAEPHFANMYAMLCFKLAKISFDGKRAFKKLLLSRCQSEFEEEIQSKIDRAVADVTDADEIEYHANLVKKNYLGHMRFIGELYKGDLIKVEVMLFCLKALLEGYEEEKVECFAKLITTIGYPLEQQSALMEQAGKGEPQANLNMCWRQVDEMIGGSTGVSNRIKFMLLDLKEMRDNGWIERRKKETAKTLDQIHKEVAREEAQAARRSSSSLNLNNSTSGSRSSLRRSSSQAVVDSDGFVQVMPLQGPALRSLSSGNLLKRSTSDVMSGQSRPKPVRRAQSTSILQKLSSSDKPADESRSKEAAVPAPSSSAAKLDPKEVEKKTQNLLKEYFASGDTADTIESLEELIANGGGRGEADKTVVEAATLLVMERKEEDVDKMLTVLVSTYKSDKKCISSNGIAMGLNDPLEFLSDIEIDAPMAGSFLAKIVARWIQEGALELEFLLQSPEAFRTDGMPALFAAKVVKGAGGGEVLPAQVAVVEKLMTPKDKDSFESATALMDSVK